MENNLEYFLALRVRVGFDFEGTLSANAIQTITNQLIIAGGTEVYIISSLDNAASLYSLSLKFGIPMTRVFAMGSDEEKIRKIKQLGINIFFDANQSIVNKLPNIGRRLN